jgi:hypothetical protein
MKKLSLNFLKNGAKTGVKLIVAGIIGLSAFSNANAGNIGIDLYLGNGTGTHYNGNNINYRHNNNRNRYRQNHQRRSHYRKDRHYRDQYHPRPQHQVCGPRRAVKKAYRLGLDSPQVHRVKERKIVVSGYQYGYRAKMVFKRYSKCHLIKAVRFN